MSGRAFVGSEINRLEQWMDTSINFATHVFVAVVKLQHFPEWLRPLAQHLVSELRQIRRDISIGEELLGPVLRERLRDMEEPGYEGPDDLMQWLLEGLGEKDREDVYMQTKLQLILAAASIHTTNNLLTECMYELAAHPDVQEMLREEAHQVLEVESGWTRKETLPKMKKLDSFMKEVLRTNGNPSKWSFLPASLTLTYSPSLPSTLSMSSLLTPPPATFIRKVLKPITLSNGTHLPAGTKLLAPLAGFSRDPALYPDPATFDPLRFLRLREQSKSDSNRYQFTSLSDGNMNFGAGRHACPGRFFAGNEVKMALGFFLLNYEVALPEGKERPKAMIVVMSRVPDQEAELLFKRRTVTG